jgi:hypothetical protein
MMPDDPTKRRLARAKRRLVDDLRDQGFEVIVSDNRPVCIVAYNDDIVRIIRTALDDVRAEDKRLLSRCKDSPKVSREIHVQKFRTERFETHKI